MKLICTREKSPYTREWSTGKPSPGGLLKVFDFSMRKFDQEKWRQDLRYSYDGTIKI
jgi:hypothetical protein